MAKHMNDLWPKTDGGENTADTRRHSSCWMTRENAELGPWFKLCSIIYVASLLLSSSILVCVSFAYQGWQVYRSGCLWQSLTRAARFTTCQVPSQAWGEQLLIFPEDTWLSFWSKHTTHPCKHTRLSCTISKILKLSTRGNALANFCIQTF